MIFIRLICAHYANLDPLEVVLNNCLLCHLITFATEMNDVINLKILLQEPFIPQEVKFILVFYVRIYPLLGTRVSNTAGRAVDSHVANLSSILGIPAPSFFPGVNLEWTARSRPRALLGLASRQKYKQKNE